MAETPEEIFSIKDFEKLSFNLKVALDVNKPRYVWMCRRVSRTYKHYSINLKEYHWTEKDLDR